MAYKCNNSCAVLTVCRITHNALHNHKTVAAATTVAAAAALPEARMEK